LDVIEMSYYEPIDVYYIERERSYFSWER